MSSRKQLLNPDVRLRELERRWIESRSVEDMVRYASALDRAGMEEETARVVSPWLSALAESMPFTEGRQRAMRLARIYRLAALPSRWLLRSMALARQATDLLDAANGRRRERTLDYADLATDIREASGPGGRRWSGSLGGTVPASYKYMAWTTAALAVRPPRSRSVYLGVDTGPAHQGSLGRVWPSLQPWREGSESNLWDKLALWVQLDAEIRIPVPLAQGVADLLQEQHHFGDWSRLEDPEEWKGDWREFV